MKNRDGWFEFIVRIISAEYNYTAHCWEYILEDWRGDPIPYRVKETGLGGTPITQSELNQ